MRAISTDRTAIASLFTRDPRPRLVIVVKTSFRIDERDGSLAPIAARPLVVADVVPRKARPEVTVGPTAFDPRGGPRFGAQISMGTIQKRVVVTSDGAGRSTQLVAGRVHYEDGRLAHVGAAEIARPVPAAPADEWQAWWSDRWVDVTAAALERWQSAPADQQSQMAIGPGTEIALVNLLRPGGERRFAMPAEAPWIVFVDPRRGTELPVTTQLKADTLNVDTGRSILDIVHRGDLDLAELRGRPDVAVGLSLRGARPTQQALRQALISGEETAIVSAWSLSSGSEAHADFSEAPIGTVRLVVPAAGRASSPATPSPHDDFSEEAVGTAKFHFASKHDEFTEQVSSTARIVAEKPKAVGGWVLGTVVSAQPDRVVFETRESLDTEPMRLSLLHAELAATEEGHDEFMEEIECRARVDHAAIVRLLDFGLSAEGRPYFVDAVSRGRSLAEIARSTAISPEVGLGYLRALLDALAAIHETGLIHGALRPEVVFIEEVEGKSQLSVVLTSAVRPPRRRPRRYVRAERLGVPREIANAQWDRVDERSDLWFAAATYLHAVTSRPSAEAGYDDASMQAPLAAQWRRDVPRAIVDLIDDALSPDIEKRPASAAEFSRRIVEATRTPTSTVMMGADAAAQLRAELLGAAAQPSIQKRADESTAILENLVPRPVEATEMLDNSFAAGLDVDLGPDPDDEGGGTRIAKAPAPAAALPFAEKSQTSVPAGRTAWAMGFAKKAVTPAAKPDEDDDGGGRTRAVDLATTAIGAKLPFGGRAVPGSKRPPPTAPPPPADPGRDEGGHTRAVDVAAALAASLPFASDTDDDGRTGAIDIAKALGKSLPFAERDADDEKTGAMHFEPRHAPLPFKGPQEAGEPDEGGGRTMAVDFAKLEPSLPFALEEPLDDEGSGTRTAERVAPSTPMPFSTPKPLPSVVAPLPVPPIGQREAHTPIREIVRPREEPRAPKSTIGPDTFAKILTAASGDDRARALDAASLSELGWARAREDFETEIDASVSRGELAVLDSLLSALHTVALRQRG